MRVLSLFDGISCGQVALHRAGIVPSIYYASEIDKHAIKVTQSNFPNTIQLGDVRDVRKLVQGGVFGGIDLLIGGSPCQGFSKAGKQQGFSDPRSQLLFEYVSIKAALRPKWWLLENVRMKPADCDLVSLLMGVEPVEIDSAMFSAQRRKRLYWTNIPIAQIVDAGIEVWRILEWGNNKPNSEAYHKWFLENKEFQLRKVYSTIVNSAKKAQTLTRRYPSSWNGNIFQIKENQYRYLTVNECEKLQTVPVNYCKAVSDKHAYEALGNGWTVDVIAHILRGIQASGHIRDKHSFRLP